MIPALLSSFCSDPKKGKVGSCPCVVMNRILFLLPWTSYGMKQAGRDEGITRYAGIITALPGQGER